MKKRVLKKSEVLREGYEQGLREGLNIINQMIAEAEGDQLNEGLFDQAKSFVKGFSGQTNRNKRHNAAMDADAEEADQLKKSYKGDLKTAKKNWDAKLRDDSVSGMKEADKMKKDALSNKKGRFSGAFKKGVDAFKKQRSIDKKADEKAAAAKKAAKEKAAAERKAQKDKAAKDKKDAKVKAAVDSLVKKITDSGEEIANGVFNQLKPRFA